MTANIHKGFVTRAATLDDVEAVVDMINTAAIADTGMLGTNRDDKLNGWRLPQFNLETDTQLVLMPDGKITGLVELWDLKPHVRHYLRGRVHPDYRGQGIGTFLMDWAEARARQSIDKAPPKARVSIHTSAVRDNQAAHELFEGRGYTLARHFLRMLIEMAPGAPPSAPMWPDRITVRPYILGQDDRAIHKTLDEAFKDHWGYVEGESFEEWFHWIENDPKFDPSVCFLAVTNGASQEEIVGVAMSRPEFQQDPDIAWIDELGVLRPWRRKGVALALLQQVFGEFYRRGKYRVGLGVDASSLTGAKRLYEKAGMHVIRQTDAYEKILRPGRDLSTCSLDE